MTDLLIYEEYSSVLHGNQKYILLLSRHLPAAGINLSLLVSSKGPLSERASELVSVQAFSDTANNAGILRKIFWLRKSLKRDRTRFILCNNERSLIVARLAGTGLGIKYIWYIKNALVFWPTDLFGSIMADKILTISSGLIQRKNVLFRFFSKRKISNLAIGVPLEQFSAIAELQQNSQPLHVLISAALTPMKGFNEFFEALEILDKQGLEVDVRIIGATPSGQEEYVQKLKVRATRLKYIHVEFAGWIADILPHLSWAEVNVLPSKSEGVPRSIIEAMAAGRAIIATDVGGVKETVPVEAGVVVPAGSAVELASAIKKLADNRHLVLSMGQFARHWVSSRYTINSHIDHFLRELDEIANKK